MLHQIKKLFGILKRIVPATLSGLLLGSWNLQDQPSVPFMTGDNMGSGGTSGSTSLSADSKTAASIPSPPATEYVSLPDTSSFDASNGINRFAFSFSKQLLSAQGSESNFVCSPISAWLPLAALVNATKQEARPALLEAIGEAGLNVDDLNYIASALIDNLMKAGQAQPAHEDPPSQDPLAIANAIFVNQDVQLNQKFIDTFAQYYGGTAMNVNFSSPEAPAAVNAWASQNTHGLISEIVREFDPRTIAAIANAIYFSDRWQWEFDPKKTAVKPFRTPAATLDAWFMERKGSRQPYFEDAALQAIRLDSVSGGRCIFFFPRRAAHRSFFRVSLQIVLMKSRKEWI